MALEVIRKSFLNGVFIDFLNGSKFNQFKCGLSQAMHLCFSLFAQRFFGLLTFGDVLNGTVPGSVWFARHASNISQTSGSDISGFVVGMPGNAMFKVIRTIFLPALVKAFFNSSLCLQGVAM
ncbi:MAG: hypothetical protein U5N26_11560 [Candidatus Marinimicrobia bacterium]|nr:hypothetical protein [Candidatus Neomarinimicrobiota bacterium]